MKSFLSGMGFQTILGPLKTTEVKFAKSLIKTLILFSSLIGGGSLYSQNSGSYTIVEDLSSLPTLNPDLSKRKTAKIRLANRLEMLIISDPDADQSAASVAVSAGSWNDPVEYPGMAHFCEHMLFMGTEKYRSENEFFSLIADYAGTTNAYTAPNRTVYMFSAQTNGFLNLLDRFAHFFIDPLFNPGNIAREMHAVDQEFAKNLENDSWREYMVFKEMGNPDHPNKMFSTGNSETLGKIPQSALKKWHEEYYGADRMHVVIYSPLPLETIQDTAVEIFSEVPAATKPPLDHSESLTSLEQKEHITYIKPIKDRQLLTLSWELPSALSDDPTKSAETVAFALRRGQKANLYENLKKEQWVDAVSISTEELGGNQHRFFQISLELTQKGIGQLDTVILRCFEALAGLKQTGIPAYLFDEKNTMAQLNYQYQGRQDPFQYIMALGDSLPEEKIETYPRNTILANQYDPEKIALTLSFLTPKNCAISLLAPPEQTKVFPDRKERWFGTEYAVRPVPNAWLVKWANAKPNPQIQLAEANPFFPKKLTLYPDTKTKTPITISETDLGEAYYIRCGEYAVPEIVYHVHILSPEINPAAKSACLASLYLDHLTDLLHPTLAAASSAGLSCSFNIERCSIHLKIAGYSEKAPKLLREVLRAMPLSPPTPEQFATYMARHVKDYMNGQKELAVRQAKELLDSLLNRDKRTKIEKLEALKTITYEEFLRFHKQLFETTYTQALFSGNLTQRQAESAWLDIVHVVGKNPFPKEAQNQTKILQLPDVGGPFAIGENAAVQGNAAFLVLDQGLFTFETRAIQEILAASLKEPFFNELRTKQKTGYIAQSDCIEIEEHLFQFFVVQSNSHQPNDLLYRFEQFLELFSDALTENLTPERFETLKLSQIESLKTRYRNLDDKSALWDKLAFEYRDFDFIEKRLAALEKLPYEKFIAQAKEYLSRDNRKRLAILFEGKLRDPFAYQSVSIQEFEEIVQYTTRLEGHAVAAP
jgi:insulysin